MERVKKITKGFVIIFAIFLSFETMAQSWTDQHMVAPYDLTTDGTNVYKVKYGGSLLYISNDEGGTWALNDSILHGQPFGTTLGVNVFITSTGRLITSRGKYSSNFKIIYSDDQGLNWIETGYTLTDYHHAIAEANGVIMIKGGNVGLYSTDNGTTWTAVPQNIKYDPVGGDGTELYILKSDSMYVVNSTNLNIISKHDLPNNADKLLSFGQNFFFFDAGEIYYSTDKEIWNNITPPGSPVVPAVFDVAMKGNDIYIATHLGVYKSSDGGATWSNPGGTSLTFYEITLTNNYIVAGYHGGGSGYTYRLNNVATGIKEIENNTFSIYPNPFTSKINVNSKTPIKNYVIYDISGKLVKQAIINSSSSVIDVKDLKKGIYFVKTDQNSKPIKLVKQ